MERNIPPKIKAVVLVTLASGFIFTRCSPKEQNPEIGDTGVAKDTVSLVINPLEPLIKREYCDIDKGEEVKKGRDSYVSPDNGVTSADVTLIEKKGDCSGWSYNGDYKDDFKWNK